MDLRTAVEKLPAPQSGQLNPAWVEWLMGFPKGWSSLEPLDELIWSDWTQDPADLDPEHPLYIPRVVTVKVPDRAKRLAALGDGQVPQCMAAAVKHLDF